MRRLLTNPFKHFRIKRRYKQFCRKWNSDAEYITKCIQQSKDERAGFKWNQLVVQEIRMWIDLDKQVTPEEWHWIVERRGFDIHMTSYLYSLVNHVGLAKLLKNEF